MFECCIISNMRLLVIWFNKFLMVFQLSEFFLLFSQSQKIVGLNECNKFKYRLNMKNFTKRKNLNVSLQLYYSVVSCQYIHLQQMINYQLHGGVLNVVIKVFWLEHINLAVKIIYQCVTIQHFVFLHIWVQKLQH